VEELSPLKEAAAGGRVKWVLFAWKPLFYIKVCTKDQVLGSEIARGVPSAARVVLIPCMNFRPGEMPPKMQAKHQKLVEARAYEERQRPTRKEIFVGSDQAYSTQRMIVKKRELGAPRLDGDRHGLLPEMSAIWFTSENRLTIWRYESNETEEITTFSSEVLQVQAFVPKPGVFNDKVALCLFVATEDQLVVLGVERDTFCLINTDFVATAPSAVTCAAIRNGDIFIGCENGSVYNVVYMSINSWSFRMMHLYDPDSTIFSHLVPSILKRKKSAIRALSAGRRFMVSLGRKVTVYNIEGGIYKHSDIAVSKEYIDVQVVDETDSSVFFYLVQKDGSRDFYDTRLVLSKRSPNIGDMTELLELRTRTTRDRLCTIKRAPYDGNIVTVVSLNEDQLVNFDRLRPSENYEIIILRDEAELIGTDGSTLVFLGNRKVSFYEIQTVERHLLSCRPEEIFNVYKNYGEKETLVFYYRLLSNNEDVGRMEYLCMKNEDVQLDALFLYLYRLVSPVLEKPFERILESGEGVELERMQLKMRNVQGKIKKKMLRPACEFIDEFLQTSFFLNILREYSVDLEGASFSSMMLQDSAGFRRRKLKELLEIFKINQSTESLIKTLSARCPLFLPIEEVYYQRGLELLSKHPSRELLHESLRNLKNVQFNEQFVKRYAELKFHYGAMMLIRESFNFDFEHAVELLRSCVRCEGALNLGLEDPREEFLYALFEALTWVLRAGEFGGGCTCCDKASEMGLSDIIKISVPFLERFLKEKAMGSSDPEIYELHWKYCVYRDERTKATTSLLELADNKPVPLQSKIELLRKALSASVNTQLSGEVRMRLELADVQLEMIRRGIENPLINNSLLSADELFNDYAYKHPDLALKIIGISNYPDREAIRELWEAGMEGDFGAAAKFLKSFRATGPAMDCRIVGDILCAKMGKDSRLGGTLADAGFNYFEVLSFLEEKIKGEQFNHPGMKKMLLDDLREFTGRNEFYEKIERYCREKYGI
jgi:nuclear pore complex protein Nup155